MNFKPFTKNFQVYQCYNWKKYKIIKPASHPMTNASQKPFKRHLNIKQYKSMQQCS